MLPWHGSKNKQGIPATPNVPEYEHLENPEVTLLWEKIYAAMNASGNGLMAVFWSFGSLVNAFSGVAKGVA